LDVFAARLSCTDIPYCSGVWRYKELIDPEIDLDNIITRPEGNTNLYKSLKISEYTGLKHIQNKHEGENPTGSFKDRGMTVAVSEAIRTGAEVVACASTGNTSASMAAYAAQARLKAVVFIPEGEIAYGKLAQALAYGARVIQIIGNFDDAMKLVQDSGKELGFHILNSINPWRIEGQKSIIFEMLQQRNWEPPDWICVPAGNLGNTSAFGKALKELYELGLMEKIPHIASIQAKDAAPFYHLYSRNLTKLEAIDARTIASAIKIGNPVSWKKAIKAIHYTQGVVEEVSDSEIMNAKAILDASGIGCEPASAASVAGAKKLHEKRIIQEDEEVVCILTGNLLKDPTSTVSYHLGKLQNVEALYQNKPILINPEIGALEEAIK
jgi:threonine synthase